MRIYRVAVARIQRRIQRIDLWCNVERDWPFARRKRTIGHP
jgi:hypothetical protein